MKTNVYRFLADVGVFTNRFKEDVIENNIYPWIIDQSTDIVIDRALTYSYFDIFIGDFVSESDNQHRITVQAE